MAESISTQYQHFVPQFLLKNFAHPFKPPTNGHKKSQRQRRKPVNGMWPNELVVHNLDLSTDPPVLCEAPVKRIFGHPDMYRDTSKPLSEQQHLEQMFSNIESRASVIFRKITKSFEQKEKGLWLMREERDLVRKFLFLLKYRGNGYHQRFYHEHAEAYEAEDSVLLRDYMTEKGYKRPMDVWFDNLKTLIELRMDPEGKWISDLPKRMFSMDAHWFIMHTQQMYMAICTPSSLDDEFILTENSYNVFEGPNYFVTDEKSGSVKGTGWAALHEFAPVSSKIMIVLRSFLLPVPEEDADPEMLEIRENFRFLALKLAFEEDIKSILADLPINKARNNYSTIVNGRVVLTGGENWKQSKNDKFCFDYFPINAAHVQSINKIFLDNAYRSSRVVFERKSAFSRILERYLTAIIGKPVPKDEFPLRLVFLQKLTAVSQSLGFDIKPVWEEETLPLMKEYDKFEQNKIENGRFLHKMATKEREETPDTEFMQIYRSLGGSRLTLFLDMEQSTLMWKLRVKIDAWSQGINEAIREQNRRLLIKDYLRLPPKRVWCFTKVMRMEFLRLPGQFRTGGGQFTPPSIKEGPEDIIAIAAPIIKPSMLRLLMYRAVINESKLGWQLGSKLWDDVSNPNLHPFEILMTLKQLYSLENGFIRNCGIDEIEHLAREQELEIHQNKHQSNRISGHPILDEVAEMELLTRIRVRSQFVDRLRGKLERTLLSALKYVFFEILYPTPA